MPKTNNLVVFGNPPYQQQTEAQKNMTGGSQQAKAIYHLFVEAVIDNLNPRYLCFITPSKWMGGGKGLNDYRQRMMKDKHLRTIKHFAGSYAVFPDAKIDGGTSYFLWDREYNGKCNFNGMHRYLDEYDVVITDNKAVSILDKVVSSCNDFLNSEYSIQTPFGLYTNFEEWKEKGTVCYSRNKVKKFVDPKAFTDKFNILEKWKACTSEAYGEAGEGPYRVSSDPIIMEPNSICTQTYIVVKAFSSKDETKNFAVYMKTKFFRFMLGLRKATQHISKEKFAFVPDLGDYSKPVTDAELYKRFGLSEEEISYIESKIKGLD